jgi:hypothetical protein
MANVFGIYPFLLKLYAYAGNRGPKFRHELARVTRGVNVEIFRRCDAGDLEAVSKRMRYDRMRARWPGQIVIRQGCNTLDETRCGPRPPGGSIAVQGYAMEAT